MSAADHASAGLIGPNAILQLLPVIQRQKGPEGLAALLAQARCESLPDGSRMIPEEDAARLHRALRLADPERADPMAAEAGCATADYILAHRIPRAARMVLSALPAAPAAHLLSGAITRHAWTFIGSGRFRRVDAWTFDITDNPLIRSERSTHPLCAWHAAVFGRLYSRLVAPDCRCTEVTCRAVDPDGTCRFVVTRESTRGR